VAPPWARKSHGGFVLESLDERDSTMMRAILVSVRPHQWTKNSVVFLPLVFSKHLFETGPLISAALAFVAFCLLSGTIYLINDIADMERDRLHPVKRLRPIASGALKPRVAGWTAGLLALGSLALASRLGEPSHFRVTDFFLLAATYLLLNLLYSFKLKNVVILDALSVSLCFVLRVAGGGLAIPVPISHWLLICTILWALFLTLCKRRHELTSLNSSASNHRQILSEYSPYLLDQMISVVTASCLTAYAFYTTAAETVDKFQTDRLTWTIPFVLYGIFRYLYLVHQKDKGGSPTDILLTDRPLLIDVALWGLAVVAIVYTAQAPPTPLGR
jgi:4-hydroxybenzoate polyprenyltransferase